MSRLRYDEGRIVERYRVYILHILMSFLTVTTLLSMIILFFRIVKYLSTGSI